MAVIAVTDATFETEVLASDIPVLIDLYADWCGPCKQVAPVMEELSKQFAPGLKVVKVDVDRNPEISASFRVQSIPMIVIMAEGRVHKVLMGAQPKDQIIKALEPVLPRERGSVLPRDLQRLVQERQAAAVDVRDALSFARAHIPGATSLPSADFSSRAAELKRMGRPVVVYARTGDESRAASEALQGMGIQVAFLKGGLLEWEGDGLPVERGQQTA